QAPQPAQAPAPTPVQLQAKRSGQGPSAAAQAPAEPAPGKEEAESGYHRRQGAGGPAAPPPPAPARQRGAESSLGSRDENASDKAGGGFAQAPPDERTRMRANVDYKNAMGVGCEKQLKLLEDFVTRYPWDSRVKEARIRIAVCRARLTGKSEDVDDVLRNIEGDRQKKSLHEAEQRATPDRYSPLRKAPARPMAEKQTYKKAGKLAPKPAAAQPGAPARAERVQQAAQAPPKAPAEKPVAKAKAAPAKAAAPTATAAAPTATAAKGKKAAPPKADEKSKSKPAAAETTSK
ncbi:MAG: hypothetical protein HY906_20210, partial [Deltaproteobacteria bacterium]|nr:hypothetical protein [Deltaproteobacteria bacterium]